MSRSLLSDLKAYREEVNVELASTLGRGWKVRLMWRPYYDYYFVDREGKREFYGVCRTLEDAVKLYHRHKRR